VSVGRLISWKGHSNLIEAISTIPEGLRQGLKVLIVGYGLEEDKLRQLIKSNSLENNVYLLGARDDVVEILCASDVFSLVFSYSPDMKVTEVISISIIEAMAARLPIFVGDYANSQNYIIDGKNGFIVPPYNPSALGDKILLLKNNKSLREEIGKNGQIFALETFGIKQIVENYAKLYNSLS
jgi:glycosyltransferase involved in cell wall biosynthesis